jgi:hypothetical protein
MKKVEIEELKVGQLYLYRPNRLGYGDHFFIYLNHKKYVYDYGIDTTSGSIYYIPNLAEIFSLNEA